MWGSRGNRRGGIRLAMAGLLAGVLSWAGVAMAAGEPVIVTRASQVKVDGDLSEWVTSHALRISSRLVADAKDVKDDQDLSAYAVLGYDDANVYVAVQVNDDALVFERSGGDIWQTDAVEVWFEGSQFGATLTQSGQAYVHSWHGADVSGAQVAVAKTAAGYNVELALPRSVVEGILGKKLAAGVKFQVAVGVDDADSQGGSREGQIYFPAGWGWGNPSTFATATVQ